MIPVELIDRNSFFVWRHLMCLVLLLVGGDALFGEEPEASKVRLLTIGNSFANNATRYLSEICESKGVELVLGKANLGGSSLKRHAEHLASYLADPASPEGRPYRNPGVGQNEKASLVELLQSEAWDYVTLQQFSAHSFRPETFEPYAGKLMSAIRTFAPQAEVLVFQTWAYRTDHPFFEAQDFDQDRMYEALTRAYDGLAERHDLKVIPVGGAFQIARAMPRFHQVIPDPSFDYKDPHVGTLPRKDGSLIVGWYWRRGSEGNAPEFRLDAKHANDLGCYLGACAFYERITGSNPRELDWSPPGMQVRVAEDLRHAAHKAVATRVADEGFVSIFNGENFEGWDYDPRYWRVEDGVMVGEVTPDLILKRNSFMIWRGGTPADFELKVEYRVSRRGNSGLSYRNIQLTDAPYSLAGYQADIDGRDHDPRIPRRRYVGQAWEERGRRFLAKRGEMVEMDESGQSVVLGSLGDIDELESFVKDDDWNEYHIIIRGNTLIHKVNGRVMSVVLDNDPVNRRMEGLIGVQVHTGPPQKIEYRNFRLKEL